MQRRSSIPFSVLAAGLALGLAVGLSGSIVLADGPASDAGWMGVTIEGAVVVHTDDDTGGGEDGVGTSGVRLGAIFEDSPAAAAGLRARDVVLDVGGRPVTSGRELAATIREAGSRSWVPLSVWRDGERRELRIRLGTRPDDTSPRRLRRGSVGAAAIDLPPALREHFGAEPDSGVMIARIVEGSPAEAAGLELGDVLIAIDDQPVRGPAAMQRFVHGAGVGNTLELTVLRDGVEIVLEAVVAHDTKAGRGAN